MRYHYTTNRMAKIEKADHGNLGEYMEAMEHLYAANRNRKWYDHLGNTWTVS